MHTPKLSEPLGSFPHRTSSPASKGPVRDGISSRLQTGKTMAALPGPPCMRMHRKHVKS